jgi:hypothetical protein
VNGVIERVLVALDAAAETRTAIAAAVRLAARAGAPLHAVFVEDEDLLSLAGSPIARHVVSGGGAAPLNAAEVELQLRAAAARARAELLAAARAQSVRFSFEVVRGAATAALAAASEHDLIVAGALARPIAGHFRVASRWLAALELAPGPFLLARDSTAKSGGVAALLRSRGAVAGRVIHAAARIAELGGGGLTVMVTPALAEAADFANWAGAQATPAVVQLRIEPAPSDAAALQHRLAELDSALLAIGADAAEDGIEPLRRLAARLACDVLVVR